MKIASNNISKIILFPVYAIPNIAAPFQLTTVRVKCLLSKLQFFFRVFKALQFLFHFLFLGTFTGSSEKPFKWFKGLILARNRSTLSLSSDTLIKGSPPIRPLSKPEIGGWVERRDETATKRQLVSQKTFWFISRKF